MRHKKHIIIILIFGLLAIWVTTPALVSANAQKSNFDNFDLDCPTNLENLNLEVGSMREINIHFKNKLENEKTYEISENMKGQAYETRVELSDNAEGMISLDYPKVFYLPPETEKSIQMTIHPQIQGQFSVEVHIIGEISIIAGGCPCVKKIRRKKITVFENKISLKGTITLPPPIEPPAADAGGPYVGEKGELIQIDGTGSSDPDGSIVSYRWIITDSPSGGSMFMTNYKVARPRLLAPSRVKSGQTGTLKLIVVDNDGAGDTDTTLVTFLSESAENMQENKISENVRTTYYIYGSSSCPSCLKIKNGLTEIYGENSIRFFDTNESPNGFYFNNIYEEVFPNEIRLEPLVGVFKENKLIAVVGGGEDRYLKKSFWENMKSYPTVMTCYKGEKSPITETENITDLFLQKIESERPRVSEVLIPIIIAALVDSVNPCAFAVFIALLTIVGFRKKSNILRVGFSFVVPVFVIYFLMGFGLEPVFSFFPKIKYLIGGFGILVALLEISDFLIEHGISLVPSNFQRRAKSKIEKVASPKGAFVAGAAVSLFLLPCTSGPYFIAINFIAKGSLLKGVPLLLLYNLIFILPLIVILLAVHSLVTTGQVKRWWGGKERVFSLVTGILIFVLSLYLLFFF